MPSSTTTRHGSNLGTGSGGACGSLPKRPGERATRIEVIFLATYRLGRIHRLWELTWPDWKQLEAFETYS